MNTRRILYVTTESWTFANHRLDHARALLREGFEVHVATRVGDRSDEIEAAGVVLHDLSMSRGIGSPVGLVSEVASLRRIVRCLSPNVVHGVSLKPLMLVVPLIALRGRPAIILGVNGLGISAAEESKTLRIAKRVIRWAGRRRNVSLLFQTRADQVAVLGDSGGGTVIPGVGADLQRFAFARMPPLPLRFVFLGRAVRSKGLMDLRSALDDPRLKDVDFRVDAYCHSDPTSPGALTPEEMARIDEHPKLTVHDATNAPEQALHAAHAALLPSRAGEGMSKLVLEALACGRPVLLSIDSGSAEAIDAPELGATFESADPESLAGSLIEFARHDERSLAASAAACRARAEADYGLDSIIPRIVELHAASAEHRQPSATSSREHRRLRRPAWRRNRSSRA